MFPVAESLGKRKLSSMESTVALVSEQPTGISQGDDRGGKYLGFCLGREASDITERA
jgi:hypothetical protein